MNDYTRTDMAAEFAPAKTPTTEDTVSRITSETLTLDPDDAEKFSKKPGRYATLSFPRLAAASEDEIAEISSKCAAVLREMAENAVGRPPKKVLCALLGNRLMTPDAIGPLTGDTLTVTRHVKSESPEIFKLLGNPATGELPAELSAISPGVLAQTGIETLELIRGAVEHVHPELVIVVDALAARSPDRLCRTIQLTDAGISPGSGIGNRRSEISRETLGCPVIALGVPTVIDSSSLIADVLESCGWEDFDERLTDLLENGRSFLVSPKDMDESARQLAKVISDALDSAFVFG